MSKYILTSAKVSKSLSFDTILLDNQASVSVFKNVHILSNIRQADSCRISGILSDAKAILAISVTKLVIKVIFYLSQTQNYIATTITIRIVMSLRQLLLPIKLMFSRKATVYMSIRSIRSPSC